MKKMIYMACMCAFLIGLLSGCGGEFAEEMEAGRDASRALTGAAVSGQAVSGQAVQTEEVSKEAESEPEGFRRALNSRYCTERYYYRILWDEDEVENRDGVIQTCLGTGKKKEIRVDGAVTVICVEKDALYYAKQNNDDEDYYTVWKIPIECHKDGSEELKTDREEELKGLNDIYYIADDIYVDDECIVYSGADRYENTIVTRYDRKSGEKIALPTSEQVQDYIDYEIMNIYRNGDCMELVTTEGIVTWNVKTGDVALCGDDNLEEDEDDPVSTEDVCFYPLGEELDILRIDMKTKEKTVFVSEEELAAVLEREAGVEKKKTEFTYLNGLDYDENHLYMEICVEYEKGTKRYVLSRENAAGSLLQYEKGLTQYLNGISANATCYGVKQGMVYVGGGDESDDDSDTVYDLKTGEARPFSWKDDLIFE